MSDPGPKADVMRARCTGIVLLPPLPYARRMVGVPPIRRLAAIVCMADEKGTLARIGPRAGQRRWAVTRGAGHEHVVIFDGRDP
jgi:hypothetical protein